jgi:hypothetical protein
VYAVSLFGEQHRLLSSFGSPVFLTSCLCCGVRLCLCVFVVVDELFFFFFLIARVVELIGRDASPSRSE